MPIELVRMTLRLVIILVVMVAACANEASDPNNLPASSSSVTATQIVAVTLGVNDLGITPSDLKEQANPQGDGTFVYASETMFSGVERFILWMVVDDEAYPLNGATKDVTPSLKWPREALDQTWQKTGLDRFSATESIDLIFRNIAPPVAAPTTNPPSSIETFSVLEYRLHNAVMETPLSISEQQAHRTIAADYGVTAAQVRQATDKVTEILFLNGWFGSPQNEIRHASDWSGESP